MRIVDLDEFLKQPPGTIYSPYEPCVFGPLHIKGETWESDFLYQEIAGSVFCDEYGDEVGILMRARRTGESFGINLNFMQRDGAFNLKQLFAIWEKEDAEKLVTRLTNAINEAY